MADENENAVKQEKELEKQESSDKASIKRFLPLIILVAVVLISAGMGFGLGSVFGGRQENEAEVSEQSAGPPAAQTEQAGSPTQGLSTTADDSVGTWYYDLEPVVANLNEPGVTRYVRVALTLEISNNFDQKEGIPFLEQKNPRMKHLLTLYLANQTIDKIRGEKNLRRIQIEILDSFNQHLFPESRPQLTRVLFKEFAIQ
jgi:flagellar basal body-associated protein FliL